MKSGTTLKNPDYGKHKTFSEKVFYDGYESTDLKGQIHELFAMHFDFLDTSEDDLSLVQGTLNGHEISLQAGSEKYTHQRYVLSDTQGLLADLFKNDVDLGADFLTHVSLNSFPESVLAVFEEFVLRKNLDVADEGDIAKIEKMFPLVKNEIHILLSKLPGSRKKNRLKVNEIEGYDFRNKKLKNAYQFDVTVNRQDLNPFILNKITGDFAVSHVGHPFSSLDKKNVLSDDRISLIRKMELSS